MKIINFFKVLGLSNPAYNGESENVIDYHHHDSTDGCELLDESVHMYEQPFDDAEEEDYAAIF